MILSNKTFLWIALVAVSGAFCAVSAFAEIHRPQAYDNLTAVELAPGQAPRTLHGVADLSGGEKRHQEKLPLQLDGAVKKVEKRKYQKSTAVKKPARKKSEPKAVARDFLEDL